MTAPSRESEPDATGLKTGQPSDIERLASAVATARKDQELSNSVLLELLEETCQQERARYLELAATFRWSEVEAEVLELDQLLAKAMHEPLRNTADQFAIECVAQLFKICTRVVRGDSTISFEFMGYFGNRVFDVVRTDLRMTDSDADAVLTVASHEPVDTVEDALRAVYERSQ